jgi:hypothetical protein
VYITDKAYTREEILQMEGIVLNALKFDLTVATPLVFLKRFLKAAKADDDVENLAHFFTERMLQVSASAAARAGHTNTCAYAHTQLCLHIHACPSSSSSAGA